MILLNNLKSPLIGRLFLFSISFWITSCFSQKVYYEIPPSPHALTGISKLHVDQFGGPNANFLKNILIQEIHRIPNFNYALVNPETDPNAAIISGEVLVYSVRDEKETRDQTQVSLIQRDVIQRSKTSSGRIRQQVFDFAEVPYQERAIHRTLDLEVRFTVYSAETGKILYKNSEKNSFQQSYIGEENILLIPLADDEMERLGRSLVYRFLEKLNPSLSQKTLVLETGTAPISMLVDIADVGHPRILHGNRYAVAKEYDKAIKIWSYVIFEPQPFEASEEFVFSDEVYVKLKLANMPPRIMQSILELHNQSFTLEELDKKLPEVVGRTHYKDYSVIIKSHAAKSHSKEALNLAAAHYNIGSVYRLQNELILASYHFAKANAFSPTPKYAQAWTDVQHDLGDYNPLDTIMDRTIEAAGKQLPPPEVLVKVEEKLFDPDFESGNEGKPPIVPVELPVLLEENKEIEPTVPLDETGGELDLD